MGVESSSLIGESIWTIRFSLVHFWLKNMHFIWLFVQLDQGRLLSVESGMLSSNLGLEDMNLFRFSLGKGFSLSVESGVLSGNLGLEDMNFLWLSLGKSFSLSIESGVLPGNLGLEDTDLLRRFLHHDIGLVCRCGLNVVEFIALHGDILAKVLVTIHTSGK